MGLLTIDFIIRSENSDWITHNYITLSFQFLFLTNGEEKHLIARPGRG